MATTTYKYAVRDRKGGLQSGSLDAESPAAVANKLREMGYAPVSIEQSTENSGMNKDIKIPGFGDKVKLKDLAVFARQFAVMINAGLSLLRALSILAEQTESKKLTETLAVVRGQVETGNSLSAALGDYPDVFPPLFINMVRAGEVGGFLDTVLLQIADNYEAEVKLRGKVKAAMTYPVVVLIMALLAVTGMLLFIVPIFAKMFADLGGELPLPTKVLMLLSDALRHYSPYIVVGLVVTMFIWKRVKNRDEVRNKVDPLKFKFPVFGDLFRKIALTRFARNLGAMMAAGVPILQALDIVADTTGNVVLSRAVRDVQESVRTGESLAKPLAQHPVFPPMVVQMLAVGEDTGALDTMLLKIAEFYDQEVEATTEQLTALIEPLMIAALGTIIGGMIIAMYMPIFKIFDLIK